MGKPLPEVLREEAGSEADSQGIEFTIGPFTREGQNQGSVCRRWIEKSIDVFINLLYIFWSIPTKHMA